MVQSIEYSGGKKKCKNKSNKFDNQQEGNKTQNPDVDSKNKRKEKFPCLICGGDHFTKECHYREEFNKFLKNTPTPIVLTDPFPTQQQFIDHQSLHGPSSSSIDEVKMMSSESINLNTRSQSYDPPLENKIDNAPPEKPSACTSPPTNGI